MVTERICSKDNKRCRSIWLSAPLFVFRSPGRLRRRPCTSLHDISTNTNANKTSPCPLYTESTTPTSLKDSACAAWRFLPSRRATSMPFIVHTLPDGTVNYCIGYNTEPQGKCLDGLQSGTTASRRTTTDWNRNRWRQGETFNGYGGTGDPFQPDPVLPAALRNSSVDYGYQRGHLLGSADRLNSKEANGQTFYMTNVHPQLGGFNEQGIWWNLENFLRSNYDTSSFRDTLYVVKAGTISPAMYKMVGNDGKLVCPNTSIWPSLHTPRSLRQDRRRLLCHRLLDGA